MPAWQVVGTADWANFSRHADLGHGLVLYPIEAFGGALFALAAAIGFQFERDAPSSVRILLYASVVLAAGGLLLTLEAAPIMLGIRDVTDPAALAHAFAGFWLWGNLRAICQVLAFIAQLARHLAAPGARVGLLTAQRRFRRRSSSSFHIRKCGPRSAIVAAPICARLRSTSRRKIPSAFAAPGTPPAVTP